MRFPFMFTSLMLSVAVSAQEPEQQSKPATKLEAFQANTGIVVVRGYTTVGTTTVRYDAPRQGRKRPLTRVACCFWLVSI